MLIDTDDPICLDKVNRIPTMDSDRLNQGHLILVISSSFPIHVSSPVQGKKMSLSLARCFGSTNLTHRTRVRNYFNSWFNKYKYTPSRFEVLSIYLIIRRQMEFMLYFHGTPRSIIYPMCSMTLFPSRTDFNPK